MKQVSTGGPNRHRGHLRLRPVFELGVRRAARVRVDGLFHGERLGGPSRMRCGKQEEEEEKGTLAPGKLADLAVLSQDIFTIPPSDLLGTESVLTMVGGEIAYDAAVLAVAR